MERTSSRKTPTTTRPPSKSDFAGRWYRNGLKFGCLQCGRCCRGEPGYVWVSLDEIEQIRQFLRITPEEFGLKYLRRVDGQLSLIELPGGDCIFFEDGKGCRVYPARPIQCRTFPFWTEYLYTPRTWQRAIKRCPGIGRSRLHSAAEIDSLAYRTDAV